MTALARVDQLPELLFTTDIGDFLRTCSKQATLRFIRKHRKELQPIKVGRELRIDREDFRRVFISLYTN